MLFKKNFLYDQYLPLSFIYRNPTQFQTINNVAYENDLLVKGLSLRNQQRIQNNVQKSGDAKLKSNYEQFVANKRQLVKMQELPLDKRPTTFDKLTVETEQLEKELTRQSAAFADAKKTLSTTWKQIQEKLKPNEVAIDLVAFNYYNKKWTDSIFYSAFVVSKSCKYPKFIPLFEKKQLEKLLEKNNTAHDTLQTKKINEQYTNKAIGDLFFQPILAELQHVNTVYLSPSGLGHQIDFAALPIDDNQTFGEKYKLHILSYPTELVDYTAAGLNRKDKPELLLYGGINYGKGDAIKNEENIAVENTDGFTDLKIRSGIKGFDYIDGTNKEVTQIQQKATQNGFATRLLNESAATEESIKALDGRTAPFILHLATHGFFFADPKQAELPNNIMDFEGKAKMYKTSDDPMMRAGLVFAGANKYWSKSNDNESIDDGILTASEISNLDLSACQLVVLSACETGLGEVKGSEGVFGLQRAFKMAGVKNIIMSLWKVPDTQTAELFDIFYSECFAGNIIHEAFQTAQAKMKAKYSPYYWAGFVLLE